MKFSCCSAGNHTCDLVITSLALYLSRAHIVTTMTTSCHVFVPVTEQIQTLDIEKEVQPVSITHDQLFALLPLHCLFCHNWNSSFRALHQSSQQQTGTWVQEELPCFSVYFFSSKDLFKKAQLLVMCFSHCCMYVKVINSENKTSIKM